MPEPHQRTPGDEDNPGALCALAASCWDRAFRGYDLTEAQKAALAREGLDAVTRALTLAPDHPQALTYKALLRRLQAALEPDPAARAVLDADAEALREQAVNEKKLGLIRRA
ncbi:MAG: hypothetical protein ACRD09_16540 [Vicinamibacterales bacterium]